MASFGARGGGIGARFFLAPGARAVFCASAGRRREKILGIKQLFGVKNQLFSENLVLKINFLGFGNFAETRFHEVAGKAWRW